jgi:hypothetical protein
MVNNHDSLHSHHLVQQNPFVSIVMTTIIRQWRLLSAKVSDSTKIALLLAIVYKLS